ncbi:helix-turn-helix domain-containing protein [Caldivirga maquilingensis]|uniref:Bacterio-opsin activator HTH domain protein n=1 Tax=Caldivirga maquilingensis (strain ATCC 700844 / DSM 13496 / JCM 10307 / IC-167) TaxID=397948 RepID=A8MAN9_CALMQ|nr:helix-turn-helix domain-containing protein [Caldivirga maquilingensis]ABW01075.1 Bacterio-opsin activator HTH domain protein [Caldivirga maquilingensis IC-167]
MRNSFSYLSFDYVHSTDWTMGTADDNYVFHVLNSYVDALRDYVFEFALLKVWGRRDLKHLLGVFSRHRNVKGVVSLRPLNDGYPKSIQITLKGDSSDSTRYIAHMLGGIEVKAIYENGIEHWGFLFPNDESAKSFLNMVNKKGIVKRYNLNEADMDNIMANALRKAELLLTPSEYKITKIAYSKGYFEVPRLIKLDELARELGLSKATIDEYIRSAIRKILEHVFTDEA